MHDTVSIWTVFDYQLTTTIEKTTTSSPLFDVDFKVLATEFQHTSNPTEDTKIVGNATSLDRGLSLKYEILTGLTIIGVFGVLSNVAVLAVLLQKRNRKLATYLINIVIGEYTTATSSTSPSVNLQPLRHQSRHR